MCKHECTHTRVCVFERGLVQEPPALRVPETRDTNLTTSKVEDSFWRGTKRKTSCILEGPDTVMVRWRKMATNPQEQPAAGGGADATT